MATNSGFLSFEWRVSYARLSKPSVTTVNDKSVAYSTLKHSGKAPVKERDTCINWDDLSDRHLEERTARSRYTNTNGCHYAWHFHYNCRHTCSHFPKQRVTSLNSRWLRAAVWVALLLTHLTCFITHRLCVNRALSAVLAIQRAQGGPKPATALTEVTGSIDMEHDASGNTIQCSDSG